MLTKPVGLRVLHRSSTGDWQFIWRTVCWSQSIGSWAQDIYHRDRCVLLPGSGLTAASQGQWVISRGLLYLFLHKSVALKSSSVPQQHPCEPSQPSWTSLTSDTNPVLSLFNRMWNQRPSALLPSLLIPLVAPPLQADMLPELVSWLAPSKKELLQLNGA